MLAYFLDIATEALHLSVQVELLGQRVQSPCD